MSRREWLFKGSILRHGVRHRLFYRRGFTIQTTRNITPAPTKPNALRVLLVDDHPMLRAGIKGLFDVERDLQVIAECDDGMAAVSLAPKVEPHVVVMDVSMPQLGGAEAAKQILESIPTTRIIALSMHEEVAFARLMLSAGCTGYALKRSAGDDLVRAVRIVARGETYIDPSIAGQLMAPGARHRSPDGLPTVSLSARETEVIRLIAQGHTSREIADALGLSPRTLETYKARGMSKLNLHTRAELLRYALRCGWLRDV